MGLWFSFYLSEENAAFLGFFSFSSFFLLFFLSFYMDCCTVSSVESHQSLARPPGKKKENDQTMDGFLASCRKELEEGFIVMMTIMMLSVRVLFIIFFFFLLLPMMIRVVRIRPEGGILQPFCFLRVCNIGY